MGNFAITAWFANIAMTIWSLMMSNVWEGFVGDNLADVNDIVEAASVTEFKVKNIRKCRVTREWLYSLENIKSKKVTDCVPESELSKVNGVRLL
jgi:hypothetical protein